MFNPVILRNVEHNHLRVIDTRGAAYGDAMMYSTTFPTEYRDLHACYPIVFRKTDDGVTFESVALFGFEEGENLFLQGDRWQAACLPLSVQRHPFLIGQSKGELNVSIDLSSPRVSSNQGHPLFLADGASTEYLERANSVLLAIHKSMEASAPFFMALARYDLLESFVLDVELDSGAKGRMVGFYTINEDKLGALSGEVLEQLNRNGYLQAIYMAIASLSNLRALIERKNRADAAAA